MNIGQAANASGVSAKMIRYYESIDLVPTAGRTESGYRVYGEDDVHVLRFILPIEQIRHLLALWQDQHRTSAEVKAIAAQHIAELDTRIAELVEMRDTLAYLAQHCAGDHRPSCPILEEMSRADAARLSRRPARLPTSTRASHAER